MTSKPILAALALSASLAAMPALAATSPNAPNAAGANGSMAVNGSGNNGTTNGQGTMAVNGTGNNGTTNGQGTMAVNGSGNNGASHQSTMANNGTWNNAKTDKAAALNPLLTDHGMVRMSKLIGSSIYNDQDKKLGNVADVVMGRNGQPSVIVRMDSKLHAVPWNKLRFGNAKKNPDNKVLMPGMTQDALNGLPQYHYKHQNG